MASRLVLLTCICVLACAEDLDRRGLDGSAPEARAGEAGRSDGSDGEGAGGERDAGRSSFDADSFVPEDAGRDGRAANVRDASGPGASDAMREGGVPFLEAGPTDSGGVEGWRLVWSDEFDGPMGSLPDPARWVFDVGGDGWGNSQLEYDTSRAENASLDGHGLLVITARKEQYMNRGYTSARIKTQGKFEHGYGRYEARMRLPFGQGIWPAFWMLGRDISSAGWPACGEIDIMENIGREPDIIHGTVHGPGYSGGAGIGAAYKLASGRFADGFHVFAIEWEQDAIRWYVDGEHYQTRTPRDIPDGNQWVYDHPFFIILNLAVGGQWPGNPDGTTTFPQRLEIDYVRVFVRAS